MSALDHSTYDDWKLATPPEYEGRGVRDGERAKHCPDCRGILPLRHDRGNCTCGTAHDPLAESRNA